MVFARKHPLHLAPRPRRAIALFVMPVAALAVITLPSAAHADGVGYITPKSDTSKSLSGDMTLKPKQDGNPDQQFAVKETFTDAGRGYDIFAHRGTGQCLRRGSGPSVELGRCDLPNSGWHMRDTSDGYMELVNDYAPHGEECLIPNGDKLILKAGACGTDEAKFLK
ncbi:MULTISPECIES: RICIN domain-containing protein [Streptomyces]|uniref:RICIN domain-containing protein n=1 Tax=Streptomyces TaxID=1883 RepID=UPI0034394F31